MRKKWMILAIILILALTAKSSIGSLVTFEPIPQGQLGSSTNPVETSEFIDIYLTVDSIFFAVDVVVQVNGPAEIVYATGKTDADQFGWHEEPSSDPIFGPDFVEIGLAADIYGIKLPGQAAKITLKALAAGEVTLTISEGASFENTSMDSMFTIPNIEGTLTVFQTAPEPMTLGLFGFGFGFLLTRKCKK